MRIRFCFTHILPTKPYLLVQRSTSSEAPQNKEDIDGGVDYKSKQQVSIPYKRRTEFEKPLGSTCVIQNVDVRGHE